MAGGTDHRPGGQPGVDGGLAPELSAARIRDVRLLRIELHDVRVFSRAELSPDRGGTTVITGPNGAGKTTFLEAVAYLGTQRSFRSASRDVMVRQGCDQAVVRAELERDGLPVLVEARIGGTGGSRTQINRQRAKARRNLAEAVPVSVFSPGDLTLVQGGPAGRRRLLDDALVQVDREAAAAVEALDRVLRQRGALLRQAGGRATPDVTASLDVWDERLAVAAAAVVGRRQALVQRLGPVVEQAYGALSGGGGGSPAVSVTYRRSWEGELRPALDAARRADLRQGATTVGPHRDDVVLQVDGRDTRAQASQGEQRALALSLRLAVHRVVTERSGVAPLLLLDDVFSELDHERCRALVRELPEGQALLTTAVPLPEGVVVGMCADVRRLGVRS